MSTIPAGPMRLIVISPPTPIADELRLTARVLEQCPVTLHLRKPGQGTEAVAAHLKRIPAALHPRIMVHGHPQLLSRFNLKGIHFTEDARRSELPAIRRLRQRRPDIAISSAFHWLADISDPDGLFDYVLLSPVFDSISKAGYRAAFDREDLKRFLGQRAHAVIALGGIDERRIAAAAGLGFAGAAVLGAVWQAPAPVEAAGRLWAACRDVRPEPAAGTGRTRPVGS